MTSVERQLLWLILTCFSTAGAAFCQPFPYKFSYLTVDEGLSHTDVNDIAQDDKGYIWLATNFGLDRYDGYAIRKFYNSNVPLNNAFKNRVIKVFPDTGGKIWLSTEGGLQSFDPRTETFTDFHLGNGPLSPVFWEIFKPTGDLIYGYLDYTFKVFKINGNRLEEQKISLPKGVRFFDMKPCPVLK